MENCNIQEFYMGPALLHPFVFLGGGYIKASFMSERAKMMKELLLGSKQIQGRPGLVNLITSPITSCLANNI